jgi:hypothetical protein
MGICIAVGMDITTDGAAAAIADGDTIAADDP